MCTYLKQPDKIIELIKCLYVGVFFTQRPIVRSDPSVSWSEAGTFAVFYSVSNSVERREEIGDGEERKRFDLDQRKGLRRHRLRKRLMPTVYLTGQAPI